MIELFSDGGFGRSGSDERTNQDLCDFAKDLGLSLQLDGNEENDRFVIESPALC